MAQLTLGVLLRHLIELLDGDVEFTYRAGGLDYRPRFTPVMRHLDAVGISSIREIASAAGITHSAASQTAAEMVKRGLLTAEPGADGRERHLQLTPAGRALLPVLKTYWAATNAAADELSREVGAPLTEMLAATIAALEQRPFRERIAARLEGAAPAPPEAAPASGREDH